VLGKLSSAPLGIILAKNTLKPITLFYGPNSAGKSTIIQSLLLLNQSQNESDIETSALIPKGSYLNLGNYREMVYAHRLDREITFRVVFDINRQRLFCREAYDFVKEIGYEINFYYNADKQQIKVKSLNLYCNDEEQPFLKIRSFNANDYTIHRAWRFSRNAKVYKHDIYEIAEFNKEHPIIHYAFNAYCAKMKKRKNELEKQIERLSKRLNSLAIINNSDISYFKEEIEKNLKKIEAINNYSSEDYLSDLGNKINKLILSFNSFFVTGYGVKGKNEEEENIDGVLPENELFDLEDLLITISFNLREMLESIVYLGPLREYPERHYIFSGISPTSVGKSGKYTSDLLFLNNELTQKVNYWLNEFGIDYEMVINRIRDEDISDVYSMRLIDKKSNISVSPLDVGFGISQILPIIVQSLISRESTILVEQPEIHIHPRLQTVFGSFLCECIKNGNQFLVETHSEHILLRIQKLIRQGLLKKEDVSVIYVDRQQDGSKCIEIRMNNEGKFLDSWPNGFFEEGYEEVFS